RRCTHDRTVAQIGQHVFRTSGDHATIDHGDVIVRIPALQRGEDLGGVAILVAAVTTSTETIGEGQVGHGVEEEAHLRVEAGARTHTGHGLIGHASVVAVTGQNLVDNTTTAVLGFNHHGDGQALGAEAVSDAGAANAFRC